VHKKCRNSRLKRKYDEMEPIGTHQSVYEKECHLVNVPVETYYIFWVVMQFKYSFVGILFWVVIVKY